MHGRRGQETNSLGLRVGEMGSALGLSVYDYHVRIPAGMQVTKQDMSKGEAIPVANKHT